MPSVSLSALPLKPWRLHMGWIVGPRTDLTWFIGGALAGYALFYLHAALHADMLLVWTVWYIVLDAPHFFGTFARTYLDREERRRRPVLLWGSLGFLLLGPAVLGVGYLLWQPDLPGGGPYAHLPFRLLMVALGLWAYWHVVRQHYGIMALYRRKNLDVAHTDRWIDNGLLYVGLLAPFLAFLLRHPATSGQFTDLLPAGVSASLRDGATDRIVLLTQVAVAGVALLFLARQLQRGLLGLPINGPKVLFLAALVPLHVLIGYHPATLTADLLAFAAFVTIFHDLQYHAIVWYYQRNRCHRPGVDPRSFGLAGLVSRHWLIYASCAVAVGVVGYSAGCALGIEPGCLPVVPLDRVPLYGEFTLQTLALAVLVGLIMHHYFVDQFIWRPSKDARLRQSLNLSAPAPARQAEP